MGKLKALLLTQGMHGMISQVEGMAKALNTEYSHKIVRLGFPWNLVPPKYTPISEIILKDKIYITENKTPDLIISCGRKSVIPSILLKKKNKKIFTIHIQDPKVGLKNFDAIIAPEHDNLNGDNVYKSKGAVHYITEAEIDKAKSYLVDKIKSQKIVNDLNLSVNTIIVNGQSYGQEGGIHKDHGSENENSSGGRFTVVLYLNRKWHPTWQGETMLYNNSGTDIVKAVVPHPGRVLFFDARIPHQARPPHRSIDDLRMAMAQLVLTFYILRLTLKMLMEKITKKNGTIKLKK